MERVSPLVLSVPLPRHPKNPRPGHKSVGYGGYTQEREEPENSSRTSKNRHNSMRTSPGQWQPVVPRRKTGQLKTVSNLKLELAKAFLR